MRGRIAPRFIQGVVMAVHRVAKGSISSIVATPARRGETDKVLQGGLPPVPYRQASRRWIAGNRTAGEPFAAPSTRWEMIDYRRNA